MPSYAEFGLTILTLLVPVRSILLASRKLVVGICKGIEPSRREDSSECLGLFWMRRDAAPGRMRQAHPLLRLGNTLDSGLYEQLPRASRTKGGKETEKTPGNARALSSASACVLWVD